MNPIAPIRAAIAPVESIAVRPSGGGNLFADQLKSSIETVEGFRKQAGQTAERFLNGEPEELHNVALTSQRAALSMELFLQVRNKVVQAYQEVMRMQV
jgi:flagellar hook-basal body complex protein FliE